MSENPVWSNDPPEEDFPESVLEHFTETGAVPYNQILKKVTLDYLDSLDPVNPPRPKIIEQQLLATTNAIIKIQNGMATTSTEKHRLAKTLTPWQIAQILLRLHHVIRIAPSAKNTDREYDLLAMYQSTGADHGVYTCSEELIRKTARKYDTGLTGREFEEVQHVLREDSERLNECPLRDLIAADNGVVYYGTEPLDTTINDIDFRFEPKKLHPFHPALIFTSKNRVNYVENAPKQVITNPVDGTIWDVESWIVDLFHKEGDSEFNAKNAGLSDLVWEVIGAMIRPRVSWGKTAWFYSDVGSNGKGTLCALMRNLVGPGAHTSIPLSDFSKDFALEPLVRANAIIVDENDVGTFIDGAANIKAVTTNDIIQINRKYRKPFAYQFFGFMVQCLNEFPQMRDKSESNYRRQLFVPFNKSFTGAERKYIKEDYLERKEVLEYVFWYAINRAGAKTPGCYYELSEPPATQALLAEYKEANDPVRAFWLEFRDKFVWDLLPFPFLYDLYKSWFAQVSPSGSAVSRQRFIDDLMAILRSDEDWYCEDKNKRVRPGNMLDDPEYFIAEYELSRWYGPVHFNKDLDKLSRRDLDTLSSRDLDTLCRPLLSTNYRGVLRRQRCSAARAAANDEEA